MNRPRCRTDARSTVGMNEATASAHQRQYAPSRYAGQSSRRVGFAVALRRVDESEPTGGGNGGDAGRFKMHLLLLLILLHTRDRF